MLHRPTLLLALLLGTACVGDVPVNGDASTDAASDDSPTATDGSDAGPVALDPASLGPDLALWLRAEDAAYDSSTRLVTSWPDHSPHNQSVAIKVATSGTSCTPAGALFHANDVQALPSVSFCGAVVDVKDDSSLQFGAASPFVLAVVVQPGVGQSSTNYALVTKTASASGATGFGLLTPSATSQFDAFLKFADPHVATPIPASGSYYVVTVTRDPSGSSTTLALRVNGSVAASASVPTESVSESGAPLVIGGIESPTTVASVPGKVAEVLVVANATSLAPDIASGIDLYLRQKYGL